MGNYNVKNVKINETINYWGNVDYYQGDFNSPMGTGLYYATNNAQFNFVENILPGGILDGMSIQYDSYNSHVLGNYHKGRFYGPKLFIVPGIKVIYSYSYENTITSGFVIHAFFNGDFIIYKSDINNLERKCITCISGKFYYSVYDEKTGKTDLDGFIHSMGSHFKINSDLKELYSMKTFNPNLKIREINDYEDDGYYRVAQEYNGNLNGYGMTNYHDGDIYIGEFKDGKRSGVGCYYFGDTEDKYFGTFLNNKRHGFGMYQKPNSTYLANYKNGKQNGLRFVFKENYLQIKYMVDGKPSGDYVKIGRNFSFTLMDEAEYEKMKIY